MIRSVLSTVSLVTLIAVSPVHTTAAQTHQAQSVGAPAKAAPAVININTATAAELDALPGIGAKTAARILEYRQKNGPFKKVEELMNVRGVGEKNFLKLKAQISVGGAKTEHDRPNQ